MVSYIFQSEKKPYLHIDLWGLKNRVQRTESIDQGGTGKMSDRHMGYSDRYMGLLT